MKKENQISRKLLKKVKDVSDKQINNTIEGRCLFLCYQPKIPKKLRFKVK